MSDVVIKVENLYKEYTLGVVNHGTLTHDLQSWWARMRGKEDPNSLISSHHNINAEENSFLALKNINFEVRKGDRIGIIGKNGAGKSTLLKILSKITTPTRGQIKIKGRIGALLEVGTGFHQELTGRENIYLNGAILGMTKKEIDRKIDEIIDFAGIDKYIDTPVKRYSSGMNVRLGFAVAAHLEPEILIVDEVLAVGDAEFQKKALGKMEDVSQGEGRTVLFVSHNMAAIHQLCVRSILLQSGSLIMEDKTSIVIDLYLKNNSSAQKVSKKKFELDNSKKLQLLSVRMVDSQNNNKFNFDCDQPIYIELIIEIRELQPGNYGYLAIKKNNDTIVLVSDSNDLKMNFMDRLKYGINCVVLEIPARTLGAGVYSVYLNITDFRGNKLDSPGIVCYFGLDDITTRRGNKRGGFLSTLISWKVKE